MSKSKLDVGLISVLLERLKKQRLPRLISLKEKVDKGDPLDDFELEFLTAAITDARQVLPIVERNPEYQPLATQVLELYTEISEKALQIENTKSKK